MQNRLGQPKRLMIMLVRSKDQKIANATAQVFHAHHFVLATVKKDY